MEDKSLLRAVCVVVAFISSSVNAVIICLSSIAEGEGTVSFNGILLDYTAGSHL